MPFHRKSLNIIVVSKACRKRQTSWNQLVGREKWGMQMIKWYLYSLPIPKAKAGAGLASVKDENYSSLLLSDSPLRDHSGSSAGLENSACPGTPLCRRLGWQWHKTAL